MQFYDPEEFEDFLKPVGGVVSIRPAIGSLFNAEINMKKLDSAGLFTVSANSFKVVKEPQADFYGLTVPLSAPFTVSEHGQYEASSGYLLKLGHAFDLTAKRNSHFLVCNFFVDQVHNYSRRVLQSDIQEFSAFNPDVSFFTRRGCGLLRSVARTWSELNNKKAVSKITLKEREDDLLASFVMYSNNEINFGDSYKGVAPFHLMRAEEFIYGNLDKPITRDQLAEVSCCSIRTLSRSFEKKYGIGPMAFIKQRRLDAAYLELLSAKPDNTTVTQVAINYGFAHTGKFAIEYGKAFGESPSTSLAR